jgi:serine phosphatase RsbU (regulator of sigma subunit)
MYTDGWTEARSLKGKEFGLESLKAALFADRTMNIDDTLADLQKRHDVFEGAGKQYDDLTAVVLEYTG